MGRFKSRKNRGISDRSSGSLAARALETVIVIGFGVALFYGASFALKATSGAASQRATPEISLRVQALNGCGVRGIGGKAADMLPQLAHLPLEVTVVDVGNFSVFDIEKSFVISRTENLNGAKLLARQLGLSEDDVVYHPLEDNYRSIHATLVVGKDFERILERDSAKSH